MWDALARILDRGAPTLDSLAAMAEARLYKIEHRTKLKRPAGWQPGGKRKGLKNPVASHRRSRVSNFVQISNW
jgi:hypothetical protein